MPGIDSLIFGAALSLFLFIGAAKLAAEQLIALVILVKKLRATLRGSFSLETGEMYLEPRASMQRPSRPDRSLPTSDGLPTPSHDRDD